MDGPTITELLHRAREGDSDASKDLTERVYAELKALARSICQRDHGAAASPTLNATALVHEAFMRLESASQPPKFDARRQFYAFAAKVMRNVVIDHARRRNARKRGGDQFELLPLDEARDVVVHERFDWLEFDEVLDRLGAQDATLMRHVELRMFAGLSSAEVGIELGLSESTARRQWKLAKAWLARELGRDAGA